MILENKYLKSLLLIVVSIHFISLYIIPWFHDGISFTMPHLDNGLNWSNVQNVWLAWQGAIVGGFASITSYFLYQRSKYKDEIMRVRRLTASRSLLPKSLHILNSYCEGCKPALVEEWNKFKIRNEKSIKRTGLETVIPSIPTLHESDFIQCIEYEVNENVSNHLISILENLQIFHSRITAMSEKDLSYIDTDISTLILMCRLIELHAMINNTFGYARRKSEHIIPTLSIDEVANSAATLNLDVIDELIGYIKEKYN